MSRCVSIGCVVGSISRNAGGLHNSVRALSLALRELGHEIKVYTIEDEFTSDDIAKWNGLEIQVFPQLGPRGIGYSPALSKALASANHDVLHQHGIWQAFSRAVWAWKKRTGGAVVISPRGMLDPWAVSQSKLKKRVAHHLFEGANLQEADVVHALNESERDSIKAYGARSPIEVIPNGCELQECQHFPRPKMYGSGKVLLFLSRLHPKKGVLELIQGFKDARNLEPSLLDGWSLVIAGWGEESYEQSLRQFVLDNDLIEFIHFPGAVFDEEKKAFFQHADAFILPSFSEGLPMAVLEAWSFGIPVIKTPACNIPEGFSERAAIRVEPNPRSIRDAIVAFANKRRAEQEAIGQNGARLVRDTFDWKKIAERHSELYRRIA